MSAIGVSRVRNTADVAAVPAWSRSAGTDRTLCAAEAAEVDDAAPGLFRLRIWQHFVGVACPPLSVPGSKGEILSQMKRRARPDPSLE